MLVILSEAKDLLFVGAVGKPATIGQTLVPALCGNIETLRL